MGEIADALARARAERRNRSARRDEDSEPGSPSVPSPAMGRRAAIPLDSGAATPGPATGPDLKPILGEFERYRHLTLRIRAALEERGTSVVAIVSALRDEGKTTVACQLAAATASLATDRSVALVDLDLRNPSVLTKLRIRPVAGVEQFLRGRADLDAVRVACTHPLLDVYGADAPQPEAHELLVGDRITHLIEELSSRYSTIFIDTPPCLIVPDTSLLMRNVRACIPIACAQRSRVRDFRSMLDELPSEAVIGKILNRTTAPKSAGDYAYYQRGTGTESSPKRAASDDPRTKGLPS